MNNKFGFNINLKNSPEEIRTLGAKYLKTKEFHEIEVTYYEHLEGVDVFEYNKAVKEICDLYHPEVSVHIIDLCLAEQNFTVRNAIFAEIENCLRYTKWLGGHFMVMHCGKAYGNLHAPILHPDGSRSTPEEAFEVSFGLSVKMMRMACDLAKEYGITIYTENLAAPSLTTTSALLNRYLDEVDKDNLRIVFDVGHCYHTKHDIPSELRAIASRVKHLHIHDNNGEKDLHQPVGEGTLDFRTFVSVLEEIQYDGYLMFELYRCTVDNLADCKQAIIDCMKEKPTT